MSLFSNTHAKRTTAFVVLLAWLFAVVSGIANACMLEAPGPASHVATAQGHAALPGQAEVGALDDHHGGSGTSKESCLKVCDEGSKAPVKLHTGFDLTDPGIAPLVAIVWNASAAIASVPSLRFDPQPPLGGPSLRVRYSRLAL